MVVPPTEKYPCLSIAIGSCAPAIVIIKSDNTENNIFFISFLSIGSTLYEAAQSNSCRDSFPQYLAMPKVVPA